MKKKSGGGGRWDVMRNPMFVPQEQKERVSILFILCFLAPLPLPVFSSHCSVPHSYIAVLREDPCHFFPRPPHNPSCFLPLLEFNYGFHCCAAVLVVVPDKLHKY